MASICLVVHPNYIIEAEDVEKIAKEVMKTSFEISQLMGFTHRSMKLRDNDGRRRKSIRR